MLISYAQNFEDIILWRALKHIPAGFYIDIGANDPVSDSVSLLFYERGWRGVHVEPVSEFAEKIRVARPGEEVLQTAVGADVDTIQFYNVLSTGMSTGIPDIASQHQADGWSVEKLSVPCVTLSSVLSRYEDRDIHWLKIDVEGMEQGVIHSWLPTKSRPWIVVVESTRPNSPEENYHEWEPELLQLGYHFAYFDGLNRFYISNAQLQLGRSFGPGPNYFDDFSLTEHSVFARLPLQELQDVRSSYEGLKCQMAAELAKHTDVLASVERRLTEAFVVNSTLGSQLAEAQIALSNAQRDLSDQFDNNATLRGQLTEAQIALSNAQRDLSDQFDNNATLRGQLTEAEMVLAKVKRDLSAQVDHKDRCLLDMQARIDDLLASTSWRMTAPLRGGVRAAGFVGRGAWAWLTFTPGSRPRRVARRLIGEANASLSDAEPIRTLFRGILAPFPGLKRRLRTVVDNHRIETRATPSASRSDASFAAAVGARTRNPDLQDLAIDVQASRTIVLFVGHTASCVTNTGVQRTVRGLASGLVSAGANVLYVKWSVASKQCVLINAEDRAYLAKWNGPVFSDEERTLYLASERPILSRHGGWLIVPEVIHAEFQDELVALDLIMWGRNLHLKIGFIFYDAIPLLREEFAFMANVHARYMQYLQLADIVWPISRWSAVDLESFLTIGEKADDATMPEILPLHLPAGVSSASVTAGEQQEDLILSVGTIEERKNQLALIKAFEIHRKHHPDSSWKLVLVGNLHSDVSRQVTEATRKDPSIVYQGNVSDEDLEELYTRCAFTVFPSVEEGFGLPILESVAHGKPCICANFGAMAEVAEGGGCLTIDVRDETALCSALEELMEDPDLRHSLAEQTRARSMIDWKDYANSLLSSIDDVMRSKAKLGYIYYWVDSTVSFPSNTGIQRVTRQLGRELMSLGFTLIPVKWCRSGHQFGRVNDEELEFLAKWNGPIPTQWHEWVDPTEACENSWLVMTELPLNLTTSEQGDVHRYAKSMSLKQAAVFYDAIPWKMKGIYPEHFSLAHKEYMIGLGVYDLVVPISNFSRIDLIHFLGAELRKPQSLEERIRTIWLPGEFSESPRVTERGPAASKEITILCVGTVEPRKNHLALLQAIQTASRTSQKPLKLVIAGRRTEPDLEQQVRAIIAENPSIAWEEEADDRRLRDLYAICDFTVYPSVEEGFGLPILESLWNAKPCICANFGAMMEVAVGGGCVAIDVHDPNAISEAILQLVNDSSLYDGLVQEALERPFKSWKTYAEQFAVQLATSAAEPAKVPNNEQRDARTQERAEEMGLSPRPKLSLCISTYNRDEWLTVNLENWARLYPTAMQGVELLVCDNASMDNTAEVVRPYLHRSDFSYHRNAENVGMLGNLRETAWHARGEYVWIVGDDDLLMAGAIERILKAIDDGDGVGLVYLNYAFTRIEDARTITDFDRFFCEATPIVPANPDKVGLIKDICAWNENFFTAIYTLVFRRDHAIKAYSQDTSGRPFSTMLTCIPTTYYVLNHMMNERGVWIGTPQIVVNMNVSWMKYAPLWILERIPEVYEVAESKGVDEADIDRWRRHTLPGVVHYFEEIFRSDPSDNALYFSPSRLVRRFKHLPEFAEQKAKLRKIYQAAYDEGRQGAAETPSTVFP